MELVREDGGVIELKEGERHEVGRGSVGFLHIESQDKSISRLHVIVELLRPASRKGKEVVGESTALKLHVHVVGRNPICVVTSQGGAEDRKSSRAKFVGKGETDWLAVGDKFALSIRRPLFFVVRECSAGILVDDKRSIDSQKGGRSTNSVENSLIGLAERNAKELESNSLEEEEGIARAVERRQRRKLEREAQQQRTCLSEQRNSQDGGGLEEDYDGVKPDVQSSENEEFVVPRQTNHVVHPVDPISEFGFVVKGQEFQEYEKRAKTGNGLAWKWKIEKKGETGDDNFDANDLGKDSKMNVRDLVKNSRLEQQDEEDDEWAGDTKEEEQQVSRAIGPNAKSKVGTRSSRSNSSDQNRKHPQNPITQLSNRSGKLAADDADLGGFIVGDDDPIDEDVEDAGEDEWMDADEVVAHQPENRPTNEEKQKPACKYGSKCYRKNKEHLAQFSHLQK